MVQVYDNNKAFEYDILLFDTEVFPFCEKSGFSLRKALSYTKKFQPNYFDILSRLYKDPAGKMYVKGAFKNPNSFIKTVNKKYAGA